MGCALVFVRPPGSFCRERAPSACVYHVSCHLSSALESITVPRRPLGIGQGDQYRASRRQARGGLGPIAWSLRVDLRHHVRAAPLMPHRVWFDRWMPPPLALRALGTSGTMSTPSPLRRSSRRWTPTPGYTALSNRYRTAPMRHSRRNRITVRPCMFRVHVCICVIHVEPRCDPAS